VANANEIDDRAELRESDVRHAHAVEASRHGRAAAPGYLGLPADEVPADAAEVTDEDAGEEQEEPKRPRRARARAQSTGGKAGSTTGHGGSRTTKGTAGGGGSGRRARASASGSGRDRPTGKTERQSQAKKNGSSRRAPKAAKPKPTKRSPAGKAAKRQGSSGKGRQSVAGAGTKAKRAAGAAKSAAESSAGSASRGLGRRARKEALHLTGSLVRHGLAAAARMAGQAVKGAATRGVDGLIERAHKLPIQRSIDVAVPPAIAWEQWLELRHLPEGTHRLTDVEYDDGELTGRIDGLRDRDWRAEVIDEREQESFAWRSIEGSDSAGLATFHPIAERLTHIELTVDVRPEGLGEAARLMFHVADRRVEEELRRFKADAELLNPDVYDELLEADDGDAEEIERG
jgi:uncharacterized membrane protein